MLTRNFLRFTLLLIGFVNIGLADKSLSACTFDSETEIETATSFCHDTTSKKIFPVQGTEGHFTHKGEALVEGVHYFVYTSAAETTKIGSDEAISATNAAKVIMYICDSNSECEQTIGLAKIKIYADDGTDSDTFAAGDKTAYCKLSGGKCTLYGASDDFSENAHAVTPTVYKIEKSGGTKASGGSACASESIGLFDNNNKLCVGEAAEKIVDYAPGTFILTGSLGGASIFKSLVTPTDGSVGILISATTNEVYHNNLKTALTSGVHVFNSVSKKEINLSSGHIESTDAGNLVMYQCSTDGCVQTVGYAKIDTYTKLTGDAPGDWSGSCTSYYTAPETAVSGTCGEGAATYSSNTFYKKESLYYKISKEGGTLDSNSAVCTVTDIGKFTSNSGVCLGAKFDTTTVVSTKKTGTDQYILTGTLSTTVFSYPTGKNAILIKEGTNVVYHDVINPLTPKLFNIDSKKEETIIADISGDATKLLLFECENGGCVRTSGFVKDDSHYFYITTTTSKALIAADYAESCTTENSGKLVTSTNKLCIAIGNDSVKEIVFPTAAGKYIISDGNGGFKTVRTLNKIISMNGLIETGKYIVKSDGVTIAIAADATDIGYLINCTSSSCSKVTNPTIGFFKQGSFYYKCNSLGCSYLHDLSGESSCTSIGQMKTGALVCLDTTGGSEKTAGFVESGGQNKYYLVHYDPASVFASLMTPGQFGVLKATENDITFDTTKTGDKCVDANFVVTDKSGSCAASEYSCSSGVCIAAKALPICDDTTRALCNKESGGTVTLVANDYCTNQAKTEIYKAEAGACTKQSYIENTYHVFQCTSKNKCVDATIGSLTGTENLLVYYFDTALSQKSSDFYYLESQRLIHCPSGSNNGACAKVITQGYYINTGNSNKSDTEANPLLLINSSDDAAVVQSTSITTGDYYLDAGSKGLDDKYSKMIYCVDNLGTIVCTSETPSEGNYLNAARNNLAGAIISCSGNPVKCAVSAGVNDFNYIDTGNEGNIISCSGSTCSTNPGSKLQGHAYIDGKDTTAKNVMIIYNRQQSKFVQKEYSTLPSVPGENYIDALKPKSLITCVTGTGCTSTDISTTSSFHPDATDTTYTITCRGSEGCLSSKALTICTDKTSGAYCKYSNGSTDTNLPVGRFCIYTDGKIYKSADGVQNGACQEQTTQGTFLFKANGNFYESITLDTSYTGNDVGLIYECGASGANCKQVISSSIVVPEKYMYTCDKDGLCSKKTSVNSGYYLVGPPSVVAAKSYLSYGKLLKCINNILKVCEVIDTGDDPVTANDNYIDASSNENIITCPGITSCYSSAHGGSSNEPKYYINGEDKLSIITCNGSGCTSSLGSLLFGYAFISGTDLSKKTIIAYDRSVDHIFKATSGITDGNYIDGSNPKNLITCTTSGGCFSSSPSIPQGSNAIFVVDSATSGHKIACTSDGCISSKIITECKKVIDNNKCYTSYTNPSTKTELESTKYCIYTDGKIYKATGSEGACSAQEGTILLKEGSGSYAADTLDIGNGIIYVCADGKCTQIISSNYWDTTNGKLYKCGDDGTCAKAASIDLGYYVLGVPTISSSAPFHTYKELMKCTGDNLDNCEKVTSITDGYFIDIVSASTNVFSCVTRSKSCSIQAGSKEQGHAYIDASDSSNQSVIISDGTDYSSVLGSQLQGHAYIDDSDPSSKSIITCDEYGCTSEDVIKNLGADKELYFIDATDPTYLITCKKNIGKCSSAAVTSGIYLDGTDSSNVHSILCTTSGCISSKSMTECTVVTGTAPCKYKSNGEEASLAEGHYCMKNDGHLYKTSTNCVAVSNANGSYLIKADGTGVELDTSYNGSDPGIILSCASSVCVPVVSSYFLGPKVSGNNNKPTYMYECDANAQCNKVTTIRAGIYVNGKPTVTATRSDLTYASLVKCTGTEVSSCDTVTIVSIDSDNYYIDIKNTLIKCNSSVCERIDDPAHGYYINTGDTTTNKYIQCSGNGCKAIAEPSNACTATTIGQLTKAGSEFKLCLGYGADAILSAKIDVGSDSTYLVNYHSSSILKTYVSKSEYYGIVKVTGASSIVLDNTNVVTVHCFSDTTLESTAVQVNGECLAGSSKYVCNTDGVCLKGTVGEVTNKVAPPTIPRVKKVKEEEEDTGASSLKIECNVLTGTNCVTNTYYLVNKDNYSLAEDEGSLFLCKNEGTACSEIFETGYFAIDKNTIYTCKEAQDGGMECSKSEIAESENACNSSTVGKIFLNQEKLSICFAYESGGTPKEYSIELNVANSGDYIIHKDATNLFGLSSQQDYAIVSVKDRIVTINKNYDNELKYVYANKSGKMKLIKKGDTCPPKTGGGFDTDNIMELNCTEGKCKTVAPAS